MPAILGKPATRAHPLSDWALKLLCDDVPLRRTDQLLVLPLKRTDRNGLA